MAVALYGPTYSTYARAARLALEEKGVDYELREVDLLKGEGRQPEHMRRHPYGKAPVLEHDGFSLYETVAINRYIDEAFPGPGLQPEDVRERARMMQLVAVLDHYVYDALVMKLLWQTMFTPLMGGTPDRQAVEEALPATERCLDVVEGLCGPGDFLVGDALSLADCHLVPMFDYFVQTDEGRAALEKHARLARWWRHVGGRPSVAKTRPRAG